MMHASVCVLVSSRPADFLRTAALTSDGIGAGVTVFAGSGMTSMGDDVRIIVTQSLIINVLNKYLYLCSPVTMKNEVSPAL